MPIFLLAELIWINYFRILKVYWLMLSHQNHSYLQEQKKKKKKNTSITLYPLEGTQHDQSMQWKHALTLFSLSDIRFEGDFGWGECLLKERDAHN